MAAGVRLTGRGKGMLVSGVALGVAAVATGNLVLAMAACLVLLVVSVGTAWAWIRQRQVSVHRSAVPATVGNRGPMSVTLEFDAAGAGPGAVLLGGLVPDWADGAAAGSWGAAALGGGRSVLRQPLSCSVRGAHPWPTTTVWLPDPFGVAHGVRRDGRAATTIVLPAVVPLVRLALPQGDASDGSPDHADAGSGSWRRAGSPGPVPRQYRAGDDLRRVHWPATARSGEPMVRIDEPDEPLVLDLELDTDPEAYGAPQAYERAVTVAASLSCAAVERGWRVRCRSWDGTVLGEAGHQDGRATGLQGPGGLLARLAVLPTLPGRDGAPAALGDGGGDAALRVGGARTPAEGVAALLRTEPAGQAPPAAGTPTAVWDGTAALDDALATVLPHATQAVLRPAGSAGGLP